MGDGVLATISGVTQENVAKEGVEPDIKTVVHFHELDKPLVLNKTNGEAIARITGVIENIETGWIGAKVVLYDDPNVGFQGKTTGGIRIRTPRVAKAAPKATATPAAQAGTPAPHQAFSGGVPLPDDSQLPF